jgi:hypothetical protein
MHKYTARTTIYWAKLGLLRSRQRSDNGAPTRRYASYFHAGSPWPPLETTE